MLAQLKEVANWLENELKQELSSQDHIASGKLQESIDVVVRRMMDGWVIEGYFLYYGKYVDTGRPSRHEFPSIGKVPLDALIEWIRVKRITVTPKRNQTQEAAERSRAFAIQTNIYENGIPTDGDERKKRFVSETLENNETRIFNQIEEIATKMVEIEFTNMIERTQKLFNETEIAA